MPSAEDLMRYREVFERIPVGIYRTTPDGRFLHANPELVALLGFESYAELAEVNTKALYLDPADRLVWREIMERDGVVTDYDTRKLRRDGTMIWLRDNARCVRDRDGNVLYYEGAVVDVTEMHDMAAQLVRSERLASVGILAAGVAHEINNPLAYLMTNLEFAIAEIQATLRGSARQDALGEVLQALAEALDGAERVRGIVTQLSDFARDKAVGPAHADIGEVVRAAARVAGNELRHCAKLHLDLPALPPVSGLPNRLVQVFVNLLVNAAQSFAEQTSHGNEVRVTAVCIDQDLIQVRVRDNGPGIAAEHLEHVFDPFFTTKQGCSGTGLGLAIAQNTVISAGGSMTAESEPGHGATFIVTLPVVQAKPSAAPPPAAPAPRATSTRPRVLVIDDEPLIGRSLKRALSEDYEVHAVTEAREALRRLDAGERYDAVLCDVMMPDLGGIELYRLLLQRHPGQAERLAFITGGAFGEGVGTSLEKFHVPVVTKPITTEEVRSLVDRIARGDER